MGDLHEIRASLIRYRDHKIKCGSFLTAVLENDLYQAVHRADFVNLRQLDLIVTEVNTMLPPSMFGSKENVARHLAK